MKSNDAVKSLAALAQNSRLEVFRLLVRAGVEGLPAGQIADELEIPAATLTFHLKELANAGLINRRRASRSIFYSLNIDGIRDLIAYLMDDCCQGRPELCQPDYSESGCCSSTPKKRKRKTKAAKPKTC